MTLPTPPPSPAQLRLPAHILEHILDLAAVDDDHLLFSLLTAGKKLNEVSPHLMHARLA
jgi:hypothetical protein